MKINYFFQVCQNVQKSFESSELFSEGLHHSHFVCCLLIFMKKSLFVLVAKGCVLCGVHPSRLALMGTVQLSACEGRRNLSWVSICSHFCLVPEWLNYTIDKDIGEAENAVEVS